MVFGKIEYLNLLPFHVFMKRFTRSAQEKASMHYKRGVPSDINEKFINRRVDAAFISSINARNFQNVGLGIIAKKEVLSVLVIPNTTPADDSESATSNVLCNLLNIQGEVLIGDKALKYVLAGNDYIDLAKVWNERYKLPFVFALLCFHKDKHRYKQIQNKFLRQKVKIPQYILTQASKRTGVDKKDILTYLAYISYDLNKKAESGLRKFYSLV